MNKNTILFVIDNLAKGGAETLLVGILPELSTRVNVIIVTLSDECEFEPSQLVYCKIISLGFTRKWLVLRAIEKLRKIIGETKPALVHAHLLMSSIIARLACPRSVPLVYSLHTIMSKDAFDGSFVYRMLEKATVRNRHHLIAVSEAALNDYRTVIPSGGQSFILKNYIADNFAHNSIAVTQRVHGMPLKLVSVGNIKGVKNYQYLVDALNLIKDLPVTLDIYGRGEPQAFEALEREIKIKNVPITLKGKAQNIATLLPSYDIFVMPSKYEGFGMAAVEAMGAGLPVLLSDIPVFKEITEESALFFDLADPGSLAKLLIDVYNNKYDLQLLSQQGIDTVKKRYTKALYLQQLFDIYGQLQPKLITN